MNIVFMNIVGGICHLGLLNLVTFLETKGYPSKLVYLARIPIIAEDENAAPLTEPQKESIISFIDQEEPALIGFSLMTYNFHQAKALTKTLKARFPHIPIVWGGVHPTFEPNESLQYADFICVGEGEDATLDLVRAVEAGSETDNIPNIWTKHNGKTVSNEIRPLIQNLDEYPFPRINWNTTYCLDEDKVKLLNHDLYRNYAKYSGKMYEVMASRGCPYSCAYCCNSLYKKIYRNKGKYLRYRSVDNVINELAYARRTFPYINHVNLQDDGFGGASEDYIEEFAIKYRKQINLPLRARIIPTKMTEKKAKLFSHAKMLTMIVGIQGSDRINKEIFNRPTDSKKIIEVAQLLKKYGIIVEYDIINSNPYETEQDIIDKINLLSKLPKPYVLIAFTLAFFPNTPLWRRAIEDGINVEDSQGYTSGYGKSPMKYPLLESLLVMCPLLPSFLVKFFLRVRNNNLAKRCLWLFFNFYVYAYCGLYKKLSKIPLIIYPMKEIIFFPQKLRRLLTARGGGHHTK